MREGILASVDCAEIRLGPDKEILSATQTALAPEHQDETRTLIFESDFALDYLEAFGEAICGGRAGFLAVTEPGRQTFFRYGDEGPNAILVSRAHLPVTAALERMEKPLT